MVLRTLGGLALEGAAFHRPKPLLLLAYLSLEGRKDRRFLADLFWMNAAHPRRSLSVALSQLRDGAPGAVRTEEALVWTELECDAVALLQAAERGQHVLTLERYRGPFLHGLDLEIGLELEEWIYSTREALASRAQRALLLLAEEEAASGKWADAGALAHRAAGVADVAALEPQDIGRLYTLLLAAESPQAAVVREEAAPLGVALADSVDEAREHLMAEGPKAGASLPSLGTSFVGRGRELTELLRRVDEPDGRLFTLTGPGGTGKTRLGLQLAAEAAAAGAWDDVHFVALETVPSPDAVPSAIASVLAPQVRGAADALAGLAHAIGDARRLVVLDNFEHLLAAAPSLAELVHACRGLCIVVTSRERLNLAEETEFPVGGLRYPDVPLASPAEALGFDAVALFVQSARRARPGFSLTPENTASVLEVCRLVAGHPLALEMAAAWVRVLNSDEIARELTRGLDLLESPNRDVPDRHRSMRATFAYSWHLLAAGEQEVLIALAPFRGGFSREAAGWVAGASVARLASLIDRSFLRWDGVSRYSLHPLLQQFLEEMADARPEALARAGRLHAEYYLDVSAGWRDAFPHAGAGEATAAIETDLENIMAAWRWAVEHDRSDLLVDNVHALSWFFIQRGQPRRAREITAMPDARRQPSPLDHRLLLFLGSAHTQLGQQAEALECLGEAARRAERAGHVKDLALAFRLTGVACTRHEPTLRADAEAAFVRALDLYRDIGDVEGTAMMLNNLGNIRTNAKEALEILREGLSVAEPATETHAVAMLSLTLAELKHYRLGDHTGARAAVEASIRGHERMAFSLHRVKAILLLADILLAIGDLHGARNEARRALDACAGFEARAAAWVRAEAHRLIGEATRLGGRPVLAETEFREALHHVAASQPADAARHTRAMAGCGLSRVALERGDANAAADWAESGLAALAGKQGRLGALDLRAVRLPCMIRLGEAEASRGGLANAEAHMREALVRAVEWEYSPAAMDALSGMAAVRIRQGRNHEARRMLRAIVGDARAPFGVARSARSMLESLREDARRRKHGDFQDRTNERADSPGAEDATLEELVAPMLGLEPIGRTRDTEA